MHLFLSSYKKVHRMKTVLHLIPFIAKTAQQKAVSILKVRIPEHLWKIIYSI